MMTLAKNKPVPEDLEDLVVKVHRKGVVIADNVMPAERAEYVTEESSIEHDDTILIPSEEVQNKIRLIFEDLNQDNVRIMVSRF